MRGAIGTTLLVALTVGCAAPIAPDQAVPRREPDGRERICHLEAWVRPTTTSLFGAVDGEGLEATLERHVRVVAHFETAAARTRIEASSGGLHLLGWVEPEVLGKQLARELSVADRNVHLPAGAAVVVRAVGDGAFEVRPPSGRLVQAVGVARCLDLGPPGAPSAEPPVHGPWVGVTGPPVTLHASPGGAVVLVVEAGEPLVAQLHATYADWVEVSIEDGAFARGWLPAGAVTPRTSVGVGCGKSSWTRRVPTSHRAARRTSVYAAAAGGNAVGHLDAGASVHVRARSGGRASIAIVGAIHAGPRGLWVDAHDLVESGEISPLAAFLGDLGA